MSSIKLIRFLRVRGPQRLLDQMGIKPANLLVTSACFISEDKQASVVAQQPPMANGKWEGPTPQERLEKLVPIETARARGLTQQ
jgi:hypothetical protein